jgi:transposase
MRKTPKTRYGSKNEATAVSQAEEFRNAVRNQRVYKLGSSPLLWHIIEKLKLEQSIDKHCPTGKHDVSNGRSALALLLTRLLKPKALYKVETWLDASGLDGLLGHEARECNDDCLGRMLDAVSEHTETLWMEAVGQALQTYPELAGAVIHYDITSCYFEGAYTDSELAQYGYSRDHRSDSKQVNLGLSVIGQSGLPLMYELLAGNTADNQTPFQHLSKLQKLFEKVDYPYRVVMVGDRAMLNRQLIAGYLREDVQFLGPWTPPEVRDILAKINQADLLARPLAFQPQSARVDAPPTYYGVLRELPFEDDEKTVNLRMLALYSRGKERLDCQKRADHLQKAMDGLQDVQRKLNWRRYKRPCYVEQRIANILKKVPAARGLIVWEMKGEEGALTLTFARNEEAIVAATKLDGRYALLTNADLDADAMLSHFKAQCKVEQRFEIVKGPIPLRPIHLHSDLRIRAMVFLTMLALLIYTILEWLVRRKTPGRKRPWTGRAILEAFEEFMVAIQTFRDGSYLWLPPPFSDNQQVVWDALDLPAIDLFLSRFFDWNTNFGT